MVSTRCYHCHQSSFDFKRGQEKSNFLSHKTTPRCDHLVHKSYNFIDDNTTPLFQDFKHSCHTLHCTLSNKLDLIYMILSFELKLHV